MKGRIIVPARWIRVDKAAGTVAVRGNHGRFKGRRKVKGIGDKTGVRRIDRDLDLNHDGKIDVYGGTIYGRTRKQGSGRVVIVRGSARAKGYERRL